LLLGRKNINRRLWRILTLLRIIQLNFSFLSSSFIANFRFTLDRKCFSIRLPSLNFPTSPTHDFRIRNQNVSLDNISKIDGKFHPWETFHSIIIYFKKWKTNCQ
jgi:hypothetical protein